MELERDELDESIWGPPPTHEKLKTIMEARDASNIGYIDSLIQDSMSDEHYAFQCGIEFEEAMRRMQEDEIIAYELGGIRFIPLWQFNDTDDGTLVPNEHLVELWRLWDTLGALDTINFLHIVNNREWHGLGETVINLVKRGELTADTWEQLVVDMKYRGLSSW